MSSDNKELTVQAMTLNEYQLLANKFATDNLPDDYAFTNGASEMGEAMGKLAKFQRKHGVPLNCAIKACKASKTEDEKQLSADLKKELGDELWQLQRKAHVCGFTLEELAISNLEKLGSRKDRGVICGSGDDR